VAVAVFEKVERQAVVGAHGGPEIQGNFLPGPGKLVQYFPELFALKLLRRHETRVGVSETKPEVRAKWGVWGSGTFKTQNRHGSLPGKVLISAVGRNTYR
jgi:hypothetical protein